MENSFVLQKTKIAQNDIYDMNNNSKIISHYETETGNNSIHSNESLSNIIDVINNNNLNLFYQDDSTNFKITIDETRKVMVVKD